MKKTAKVKSDLPNKIKCSACGKSKGVRPQVLEKRLKDYGNLETLLAKYECRDCRKRPESKAPTAKKARSMPGANHIHPETGQRVYFWQMPGWKGFEKLTPYKPTESRGEYLKAYQTTCALPQLYLDNGRHCLGCPFFPVCACPLKRGQDEVGRVVTAEGGTKKMSYYMRKKLGLLKFTHKK